MTYSTFLRVATHPKQSVTTTRSLFSSSCLQRGDWDPVCFDQTRWTISHAATLFTLFLCRPTIPSIPYASFVLSNLSCASITRWLHPARVPFLNFCSFCSLFPPFTTSKDWMLRYLCHAKTILSQEIEKALCVHG